MGLFRLPREIRPPLPHFPQYPLSTSIPLVLFSALEIRSTILLPCPYVPPKIPSNPRARLRSVKKKVVNSEPVGFSTHGRPERCERTTKYPQRACGAPGACVRPPGLWVLPALSPRSGRPSAENPAGSEITTSYFTVSSL